MNELPDTAANGLPIAAVERETGIPKDLLRMWERRYGFPQPLRDSAGDRLYSQHDLSRLRLIRRLLDLGFRPGKLMKFSDEQLQQLASEHTPQRQESDVCQGLVAALKSHDAQATREYLRHRMLELGLRRFTCDFLPEANQLVGESWMRGLLQVAEEHLYSEAVSRVMRETLAGIPSGVMTPRVMLTTPPGELHLLGLLMVEALLRLEGCETIAFGAQMPLMDIAFAADKHQVDVVVLSFSAAYEGNPAAVIEVLSGQLSPAVALWVGGGGCRNLRQMPPRVQHLQQLTQLEDMVLQWRQRRVAE
ncbi:MAG: MerR family transcriptional regulator [Vogesella sp.]|uniref:MerR family transcriptional regulator n=1 Tax=Vogesella sp. TaxID=1904252 RepID=UPI003918BCBA